MTWPTPAEFETLLGEDFDSSDTSRAKLVLDLAVGLVEGEAGQPLEQSTDTTVVDGTGTDTIILPRWPVTDVESVQIDDADPLTSGFKFSQDGTLVKNTGKWDEGTGNITVVYTAGFSTISDDLRRIVLRLAKQEWNNPSGATQETLGDHSISFERLTDTDIRRIHRYSANVPR